MKKNIYYYSQKKLQYIEIKKFYSKFLSIVAISSIVAAGLIFGGYIFITNLIYPDRDYDKLMAENKTIKTKFIEVANQVRSLGQVIDELRNKDNELRLSVNLKPQSDEEKSIGIGGYTFKEIIPSNVTDIKTLLNDVDYSLDILKSKVIVAENNYSEIESTLKSNLKLFNSIPAINPTNGPIGDRFGMRLHPILKIRRMHTGVDIVVDTGTDVSAPGDAKVIFAGRKGGYGNVVELDHGFGYQTLYAHLSAIKVKNGQKVKRGDLLGLSGSSGELATGPHLHYELSHNGINLNPENFIFSDIKAFDLVSEQGSK
ncbi:MAG: M23 family metallopeptidase [Ignavibacteriales bacterium]|nr:M23 family metallopeptidase [Ignavibacteriota bacterium]MCB9250053.1 M23 family metallopeptidase [Ignavibacteriales bacterium]